MIAQFQDKLSNAMSSETEKQAMARILFSKQAAGNEKLIIEQGKIIESLKIKCSRLETELEQVEQDTEAKSLKSELKLLLEENQYQKQMLNRMNAELSWYLEKYPSSAELKVRSLEFYK